MASHRLRHDLDEDPTVQDGHTLDEPLEFQDGEALVDDEETARQLAARHTHVEYVGPVDAGDGGDTEAEPAATPFDPGGYTIDDLESELSDGDYSDDELDALADAERNGQDREGALDTIDSHREG